MIPPETRWYEVAGQRLEIHIHGVPPAELSTYRERHPCVHFAEHVLAFLRREELLSCCLGDVLDDLSQIRLAHPNLQLLLRLIPPGR